MLLEGSWTVCLLHFRFEVVDFLLELRFLESWVIEFLCYLSLWLFEKSLQALPFSYLTLQLFLKWFFIIDQLLHAELRIIQIFINFPTNLFRMSCLIHRLNFILELYSFINIVRFLLYCLIIIIIIGNIISWRFFRLLGLGFLDLFYQFLELFVLGFGLF